jgi:hypothetical protein
MPQKTNYCPEKSPCPPQCQRGLYIEPWTHKTTQFQETSTLSHNEPRKIGEQNIRYCLEKIVLHGKEYYVESNFQRGENELDFVLKREEVGTELRRSPYGQANGKIEIVSAKVYVPVVVRNNQGKRLISASLRTEGRFGVIAESTQQDLGDVQVGVLYETNEDTKFKLKTALINGREYFVPAADGSFYITPLSSTQISTEKVSGRIRLTNQKDGFFKLEEIPAQQYNLRKVEGITNLECGTGNIDKSTAIYSPQTAQSKPSQ